MTAVLILDVTSLLRWSGPANGIARVEHALAMAALRRADTVLACHDPALGPGRLRALNPAWRDVLLGWSGRLDPHRQAPRTGVRRIVPGRHGIVSALERLRLSTAVPGLAGAADLMQRAVLGIRRHDFQLLDAGGRRLATVPPAMGLTHDIVPGPADALLSAGNNWDGHGLSSLAASRARGVRTTVLCYDLIPITHPHFFEPNVARSFRAYWRQAIPLTDRVIVNAACIGDDLRRFCAAERLTVPEIVQRPLGFDPPAVPFRSRPLPAGLQPGRYALFVSTIEPRKGHATLLRAWRLLLARGVPQRSGFRLVFVGREGWMVDGVMAELAEPAWHEGTVLHLQRAGDAMLEALYAGAAFCLYPSAYEGFGLPVIEAFAHGKPVLASTGGAVRETAGPLAPCLDPVDSAAWAEAIESWMQPATCAMAAARITAGFSHPDWPTAADAILDAAVGVREPP